MLCRKIAFSRGVVRKALGLRSVAAFAVGASVTACLPNDTKPVPGNLLVTATSDGVTNRGIAATETADGWAISFERVLVAVGNVDLESDHCTLYSTSGYNRILDMSVEGPQKVSLVYALGQCDFAFRVSSPDTFTVLGKGASEAEETAMRTPGSDDYATNTGISIYVRGHASLGDMTKTFEWSFRRRARYEHCATSEAMGGVHGVELASGKPATLDLQITPGVLFQDDRRPSVARPRFQIYADADTLHGNADGAVTLEELGRVPLSEAAFSDVEGGLGSQFVSLDAGYVERLRRKGDAAAGVTLEDYVYLVLFPAMVRYPGDGSCSTQLTMRGRG